MCDVMCDAIWLTKPFTVIMNTVEDVQTKERVSVYRGNSSIRDPRLTDLIQVYSIYSIIILTFNSLHIRPSVCLIDCI